MKRYAWITDPHLNFLSSQQRLDFISEVQDCGVDGVFMTGDISEGHELINHLQEWNLNFGSKLWFILGNHDFYNTGVDALREKLHPYCVNIWDKLYYLSEHIFPVSLGHGVGLVGMDGWGDGHYGDPYNTRLLMSDWMLIKDLIPFRDDRDLLLSKLQDLARVDANLARESLRMALEDYDEVVFLTHVPPWPESALYKGKRSDPNFAPWFINKTMGDMLLDVAHTYPDKTIHVLSGHVHSPSYFRVTKNMYARTSGAVYNDPKVTRIFTIDDRDLECEECRAKTKSGFGWVAAPPSVYFCSEYCGIAFGYNIKDLEEL